MRVWCRAVVLRGFVYFVRDHTRPTVPRVRSAAALRDDGEVPEILLLSDSNSKGKGIKPYARGLCGLLQIRLACFVAIPKPEADHTNFDRFTFTPLYPYIPKIGVGTQPWISQLQNINTSRQP